MTVNYDETSLRIPLQEYIGEELVTIENAELLENWHHMPAYMAPNHSEDYPHNYYSSCSYCGVGDGAIVQKGTKTCTPKDSPSAGCVKFEFSRMKKNSAYPIHIAPSIMTQGGARTAISYSHAIDRFADLLLEYMKDDAQIIIYACGQVDYFAIFAMQEVFRLLGVRNLTGNAEHCLNAGAVHNEMLTGQEGPFVTIEQALRGDNKFYILNGWNGFITHPPIFNQLLGKKNLDAVLFDVMLTESAQALQNKLSEECIGLIKPGSDPHIALAVAHVILRQYPNAVKREFIHQFSDIDSFNEFEALVRRDEYSPKNVSKRVAAEPIFEQRMEGVIQHIVEGLVNSDTVPIIIPSVGLSQSSGVVAHCLWACVIAMIGKFGLDEKGELVGGVLRLPGQINAESEVQGLSRKYFMGRIPMHDAVEAARRMGLPDDAYDKVLADEPISALDYSEPSEKKQLFVFFGTQFEANMPNRKKWLTKLTNDGNKIVVVDPIVDDWSLANAELVVPSPPHTATPKLYQNGEWRLSLSMPLKKAAPHTRSDATIVYDVMAEIVKRFDRDISILQYYPHLKKIFKSGYMHRRFCSPRHQNTNEKYKGLLRVAGEVSRVELFDRVQEYLGGGSGRLYCFFEDANGDAIVWQNLLDQGAIIYGGVGKHRFLVNYENDISPFSDIYRNPRPFTFFSPSHNDLKIPSGIVLNSGRSSLSDNQQRVQFAIKSFNSGKATPVDDIPEIHPVHVSKIIAQHYNLKTGDWLKLYKEGSDHNVSLPVVVSSRIFGNTIYVSFHRSRAQKFQNIYINDVTDNQGRCAYSGQAKIKLNEVLLEKLSNNKSLDRNISLQMMNLPSSNVELSQDENHLIETSSLNDLSPKYFPSKSGGLHDFIVRKIIPEVDGCTTFRLSSKGGGAINFLPGQYCMIHLLLNGRKQIRAYSISSSPKNIYEIDITVKRVNKGLVSNWLADNVLIGDTLSFGGVAGTFYLTPLHAKKKLFFIGAGSGLTPLMSMIRWLAVEMPQADIDFYISARSLSDVIFWQELIDKEIVMPNFNLWIIPTEKQYSQAKKIISGRISNKIVKHVSPDFLDREVFLCGPERFMESATDILLALGHCSQRLHKESFGIEKREEKYSDLQAFDIYFLDAGVPQSEVISSDGSRTLLELSEEHNVGISSVCRSGICGACLVKVSGKTTQETTDQLSESQMEEGYRLACICYPQSKCQVDLL